MFPVLPSLAVLLLSMEQPCLPPSEVATPSAHEAPGLAASAAGSLDALAGRLSAWLDAHTGYSAVPPPPLRRVSEPLLKSRCFPAFPPHLVPRVLAAYDADDGVVYLSEQLDMSRRVDRSYLLHELVHHVQNAHGALREARCKGKLEGEAVRLQLQWLEEQGEPDPFETLGIDARTLRILESCPGSPTS